MKDLLKKFGENKLLLLFRKYRKLTWDHEWAEDGVISWKELRKIFKEYAPEPVKDFPKIICICGSTRFADLHTIARWEFEKTGKHICLMINYLPQGYFKDYGNDHYGEQYGNKEILDELHKRKIDLADEVFVINKNGYIGESTRSEINYAILTGKPVKYLESFPPESSK